jgi:2-methylaconitate cis-trans-isomerase PrpF
VKLTKPHGSPDAYSRQLDGLGGGTSSTSKICIIERIEGAADLPAAATHASDSNSAGAAHVRAAEEQGQASCDVTYVFGQVAVHDTRVDYSGTCGNLAAAVGEAFVFWKAFARVCVLVRQCVFG